MILARPRPMQILIRWKRYGTTGPPLRRPLGNILSRCGGWDAKLGTLVGTYQACVERLVLPSPMAHGLSGRVIRMGNLLVQMLRQHARDGSDDRPLGTRMDVDEGGSDGPRKRGARAG